MSRDLLFLRGTFLLLVTQGCFCNNHEDEWTFTFPQSINAVRHSDVEIPCTFTSPADYGEVRIVWYKYSFTQYPIVYSEDPSEIIPEYRGRTSLIHNGANSCSLRITDVTETVWYYPGISTEINSYTLNQEETKKAVQIGITGCSRSSCNDWELTYPRSIKALKGSCVEIPCKLKYPDNAQNLTLFWNRNAFKGFPQIFNNRTSADIEENYKGRTFLVGNSMDSCSLRINDVQEPVEIYPGINDQINGYNLYNAGICKVSIIDSPSPPLINGYKQLIENEPVQITCSVDHTCPSSPPSITWNKPELPVTMSHEDLNGGIRRTHSTIIYNPSYEDDKTRLQCTVTFPNKRVSSLTVNLNIKYPPKNVTVTVIEMNEEIIGNNVTLQCNSVSNPDVSEYEWYKGKEKTKLSYTGREITMHNVTWNMEPYSCAAINSVGRGESAVREKSVPNEPPDTSSGILPAVSGVINLLLLVLLVYWCWRNKLQKIKSNETEASPDATYTDLVKRDIGRDYDQLQTTTSPDTTYTALEKRDIGRDYDQLKPVTSTNLINTGGHGGAATEYVNVMPK